MSFKESKKIYFKRASHSLVTNPDLNFDFQQERLESFPLFHQVPFSEPLYQLPSDSLCVNHSEIKIDVGPGFWKTKTSVKQQYPDTRQEYPESRQEYPESQQEYPESRQEYPEIRQEYPESRQEFIQDGIKFINNP
jgi:hypothetical protein